MQPRAAGRVLSRLLINARNELVGMAGFDPNPADDLAPSWLKPPCELSQLVDRFGKILHRQRRGARQRSEAAR